MTTIYTFTCCKSFLSLATLLAPSQSPAVRYNHLLLFLLLPVVGRRRGARRRGRARRRRRRRRFVLILGSLLLLLLLSELLLLLLLGGGQQRRRGGIGRRRAAPAAAAAATPAAAAVAALVVIEEQRQGFHAPKGLEQRPEPLLGRVAREVADKELARRRGRGLLLLERGRAVGGRGPSGGSRVEEEGVGRGAPSSCSSASLAVEERRRV